MTRKYVQLPPAVAPYIPGLVELVRRLSKAPPARVDAYAELSTVFKVNPRHVQRIYLREAHEEPRTIAPQGDGHRTETAGDKPSTHTTGNQATPWPGNYGGWSPQWGEEPAGPLVRPEIEHVRTLSICRHGRLHDPHASCSCADG